MIENIRVSVISNSNTLNDNVKSATRTKIKIGHERNCISDYNPMYSIQMFVDRDEFKFF